MRQVKRAGALLAVIAVFFFALSLSRPHSAHAIDKRLKLTFKTAGYGAAAGLATGGAAWVLGVGDYRTVLIGTSVGMYAGILLAAYIIATPNERREQRPEQNPYAPREPISPDEWQDEQGDPEEIEDFRRGREPDSTLNMRLFKGSRDVAVWTPVLSIGF